MDLEEHSGTEESDVELLKKALIIDSPEDSKQYESKIFTLTINCCISNTFFSISFEQNGK